ncbi:MAG: DUF3341 domain-containing protein [Gemmatimonadetes bacterium]|nr:DUF3341 domain-containing protein [Gemmatimonadota bacterium]
MNTAGSGLLGIFDGIDTTIEAVQKLRAAGLKRPTVFSPAPDHELEHAIHAPQSPVRIFALVGALTGTATGFALPTWTSLDWPLVTGGKPIISLPAWVIIAFELTILFGALSTVLGLFVAARLPNRKPLVIYDTAFSTDQYGVHVLPPAGREAEVRQILRDAGAISVREERKEAAGAV